MRIRIDTDQVRDVGRRMISDSDRLLESGRKVVASGQEAEWESHHRLRLGDDLSTARSRAEALGEALLELGRKLMVIAERFEQADDQAAAELRAKLAEDATHFDGTPYDAAFIIRLAAFLALMGMPLSIAFLTTLYRFFPEQFMNLLRGSGFVTYKDFGGELFKSGDGKEEEIRLDDIDQGDLGDCYLMAAMGAIAQRDPEYIRRMIKDNGDGTYTVTFYELDEYGNPVRPVEITVDGTLPTLDGETPCYGKSSDDGELWPAIIEMAYTKWKGGEGDYEDVRGGWSSNALAELTGVPSQVYQPSQMGTGEVQTAISAAINGDHPACVGINGHAYVIRGVDSNGNVLLYNPWGPDYSVDPMSVADLQEKASYIHISAA